MQPDLNSDAWLAEERELVRRARDGERAAVAALYRAFAGRLYASVLMPRLGNAQAAEDALAETFRTALERLAQFEYRGACASTPETGGRASAEREPGGRSPGKNAASIYFWLSRIAVNKALDMHRVKARTRRALASFEELVAPLRPSPPRPERALVETERDAYVRDTVATVLERINPRYRQAIALRFMDEKSREECAAAMDVKLGTFDVLLLRALRAFRKEWDALVGPTELREHA